MFVLYLKMFCKNNTSEHIFIFFLQSHKYNRKVFEKVLPPSPDRCTVHNDPGGWRSSVPQGKTSPGTHTPDTQDSIAQAPVPVAHSVVARSL